MSNPFNDILADIVTLKKQSGEIVPRIKASVQRNKIFIFDGHLVIEEGDILSRELSNGSLEDYVVIDRGYYEKVFGVDAHYQCEVEKTNSLKAKPTGNTINYFNGPNARYNYQSNDNSTNIVLESTNLFQSIRTVIEDSIEDEIQKAVILEKVDEMDKTKGTPTFKEKYLEFMQALGNHVTVISPFLQPFNQLLNIKFITSVALK